MSMLREAQKCLDSRQIFEVDPAIESETFRHVADPKMSESVKTPNASDGDGHSDIR